MGRTGDYTHLVVVTLWAVVASIQVQETLAAECASNQYQDTGDERCKNCTDCSALSQLTLASCSEYQNTACSSCDMTRQFFDRDTGKCVNCTVCVEGQKLSRECTMDEDTVCDSICQSHQYYDMQLGRCLFDCTRCSLGCVTLGTPQCRCSPSNCYTDTDLLCENNVCTDPPVVQTEATQSTNPRSDNLPTWGIGLISIGVVVGIIAFSAGSMILSFCTRRATVPEDNVETGVNSSDPIVGRYSSSHPSPFLHHALEKYRQSPSAHRNSASNVRMSPQSLRAPSSSRPENVTPI